VSDKDSKDSKEAKENKTVDKSSGDVKESTPEKGPEVNPIGQRVPPRVVQDMLNMRRQLKTQLAFTETFLRKQGARLD
jgi:hypothetical protein